MTSGMEVIKIRRDTDANRRKWSEITQMRDTRDKKKKKWSCGKSLCKPS